MIKAVFTESVCRLRKNGFPFLDDEHETTVPFLFDDDFHFSLINLARLQ